jgi:hypothetical protein
MNAIFKKLNFKNQEGIYIINAPDSFKAEMDEMKDFTDVRTSLTGTKSVDFFLAFVTKQKEVDDLTRKIAALAEGDSVIWFAYPKGTSRRYKCEFNRDTGWNELGKHGFEGVRMVAIDDDWSALRFRKVEFIKVMKRSFAVSEEGKKKTSSSRQKKQ